MELLDRHPPAQKVEIPPATHMLDIYCASLTSSEVKKAIKALRQGKAAGPDDIPAEARQHTCQDGDLKIREIFWGPARGHPTSPTTVHIQIQVLASHSES